MNVRNKIINIDQVLALRIGDVIKRFPSRGDPRDVYDNDCVSLIDTYIIKSIQPHSNMIELVEAEGLLQLFGLPGTIGRLFIHKENLVKEKVWWL